MRTLSEEARRVLAPHGESLTLLALNSLQFITRISCANLGHLQDDESGLIYMRARYYEPSTGRFISEDPARDGSNWYGYCSNKPSMNVDVSGLSDEEYRYYSFAGGYSAVMCGLAISAAGVLVAALEPAELQLAFMMCALGTMTMAAGLNSLTLDRPSSLTYQQKFSCAVVNPFLIGCIWLALVNAKMGGKTIASLAGITLGVEAMKCIAFLMSMDLDNNY